MLKCPGNILDQEHYTNLSPMLLDPIVPTYVPGIMLAQGAAKFPWTLAKCAVNHDGIFKIYLFITVMYMQVIEVYYGNVNKWKGNRVSKGEMRGKGEREMMMAGGKRCNGISNKWWHVTYIRNPMVENLGPRFLGNSARCWDTKVVWKHWLDDLLKPFFAKYHFKVQSFWPCNNGMHSWA